MARGLREIQGHSRISDRQPGHEPWRIQGDLLVGMGAPFPRAHHRAGSDPSLAAPLALRPDRPAHGEVTSHPFPSGRAPGSSRLVHGEERSRRADRRQPIPSCCPSASGIGHLFRDHMGGAEPDPSSPAQPIGRNTSAPGAHRADPGPDRRRRPRRRPRCWPLSQYLPAHGRSPHSRGPADLETMVAERLRKSIDGAIPSPAPGVCDCLGGAVQRLVVPTRWTRRVLKRLGSPRPRRPPDGSGNMDAAFRRALHLGLLHQAGAMLLLAAAISPSSASPSVADRRI